VTITHGTRNYDIWHAQQQDPEQCAMNILCTIPMSQVAVPALDGNGNSYSADDSYDRKAVLTDQSEAEAGCSGIFTYCGNTYILARPGDVDADGYVDVTDLLYLVGAFGDMPGDGERLRAAAALPGLEDAKTLFQPARQPGGAARGGRPAVQDEHVWPVAAVTADAQAGEGVDHWIHRQPLSALDR
jgi:hypothetical protein